MTATYARDTDFGGANQELIEQLRQEDPKEIAAIAEKMIKNFWEGRPVRDAMRDQSKYSEDVILFALAFFYTE